VFIHGGNWPVGTANDYGYPAEMFVNAGAHYVVLDFIAVKEAGGDLGVMAARTIRYRDVPVSAWSEKLLAGGIPAHIVKHLSVMTELNKQGRYDRMTDDLFKLTGQTPTSMREFVKLHAAEFTRSETGY
jgi:hypothetical protein